MAQKPSYIENSALQHGLHGCLIRFAPLPSYLSSVFDQMIAFTNVGPLFISYLTIPNKYHHPSKTQVKSKMKHKGLPSSLSFQPFFTTYIPYAQSTQ